MSCISESFHFSTDISKPVILVVKKNKAVLTAVRQWLKPGSPNLASKNILIIDDECDNASINTKTDEDPSTINSLIRDIYNNYSCATYIGYTATPFANIFINPTNDDGNDDLFPDDFPQKFEERKASCLGLSINACAAILVSPPANICISSGN